MYRHLDKMYRYLGVYVDTSIYSIDDSTSQPGYIVLLCDDENAYHIIDYGSKQSKRMVRPIMDTELYAFKDALTHVLH